MIYFDTLNREHFGAFRQQLWSFLHFPFHTALVLSLAGMAQFVIWQKIIEGIRYDSQPHASYERLLNESSDFVNSVVQVLNAPSSDTGSAEDRTKETVAVVQSLLNKTFKAYPPNDPTKVNEDLEPLTEELEKQLLLLVKGESKNVTELEDIANNIGFQVEASIMSTYGFEGPKAPPTVTGGDDLASELQGQINTAALIVCHSPQGPYTEC